MPQLVGSWWAFLLRGVALLILAGSGSARCARSFDCTDGGPPPDAKLDDFSASTSPASDMEHSPQEMIDYIREHYSSSLADDMQADLLGPNPCVEFVELWDGDGMTDATTIAIRTRGVPLWFCSLVLTHEYTHWTRARTASISSGNPAQGDPETSAANPCGWCNHAMMGVTDIQRLWFICGDLPQEEIEKLCKAVDRARRRIAEALTQCSYEGCTSCCGFGYVPNVDEILSIPDCCD